jgi:hypothetical protein
MDGAFYSSALIHTQSSESNGDLICKIYVLKTCQYSSHYSTLYLPRGKIRMKTGCIWELPTYCSSPDLPDPTKTQSNVNIYE